MPKALNRPEDRLATRLYRHTGVMKKEVAAGVEALASASEPNKKRQSSSESSRRRQFYEKLVRATKSKYEKSAAEYRRRKKPRTEYERIVEKMF